MASNYPSDTNNASLSKPGGASGSQSGPGRLTDPSGPSTPASGGNGHGHQRRLASGTELSGQRYKIEKPVAAGGTLEWLLTPAQLRSLGE